jgi:hypothetical protein
MKIVIRKILSLIIVLIYLSVIVLPIAILCLPITLFFHFSKLLNPNSEQKDHQNEQAKH